MKLIGATRVHMPDPDELKVLLLKLYLEDPGMDEWVFMENDHSFSGEHKGHLFNSLIHHDERFQPYRDKITVLEVSYDSKAYESTDRQQRMELTWGSENFLKDSPVRYLTDKYGSNMWVSVADADEMLDFRDPRRADIIRSALDQSCNEPLFLPMVRYWYDYDNWARGRGYPLLPMELIKHHNSITKAYDDYRHEAAPIPDLKTLVAFEYCACCGKEQILHKWKTEPFYYFTMEDIDEAFRCNYWPKARQIGEQPQSPAASPDNWFETTVLDEWNSPTYVREHLAELKTYNIDPKYKENRKMYFPEWFK